MKAVRKLKLSIDELEIEFDFLTDYETHGDSMYEPEFHGSFLDLTTGSLVRPETEEEADDCFADDNLLLLPADLFQDVQHGSLNEFVSSMPPGALRDRLEKAIQGKGAFRRFKQIIFGEGHVELKHQWHWQQTRRQRQHIADWLASESIIPDWGQDIFASPALPDKRSDLLRIVHDFVCKTRKIPGVRRIALLGSLTTNKPIPKDIDLLVCIEDEMPLNTLAKYTRQLNGAAMTTGDGCGADVFLHNPNGTYLGRVCTWKQCAPGIRMACRAQHCGRREYLSDDLQVIHLDPSIIANPPLVLWPEIVAQSDMPSDVHAELIVKLHHDSRIL